MAIGDQAMRIAGAGKYRYEVQHGAEDERQDAYGKSHVERRDGRQNGAGAQKERQQETCSSGKC